VVNKYLLVAFSGFFLLSDGCVQRVNRYLFMAFSALWVIFFLYAWSLSRRQARLGKELKELKNKVGRGCSADSRAS
jgi:CcmD family protein